MSNRINPKDIPERISSLNQPVLDNTVFGSQKASQSVFGDHRILTDAYDESNKDIPCGAQMPTGSEQATSSRVRMPLEPVGVVYDNSPAYSSYNAVQYTHNEGNSCSVTVDATRHFVRPNNIIPKQDVDASPRQSVEWTSAVKSTYKVTIVFRPRNPNPDPQVPQYLVEGTAVHLGEGIFLTNAHVCQWLQTNEVNYKHTTHKATIWLRGGSGDLAAQGIPGTLGKDIKVSVIAWSPDTVADAMDKARYISGGLLDGRYTVKLAGDFCLLKQTKTRWLARLRRDASPYVLPQSLKDTNERFPISFVGVNGANEDLSKYDPDVNTERDFHECIQALCPNKISLVASDDAEASILNNNGESALVGSGAEPHFVRYPISAIGGSSGSGMYHSDSGRLVAIHTRSESDAVPAFPGVAVTNTQDSLRSVAICLTCPTFKHFISGHIIPQLHKVGNRNSRKIAEEWAKM